MRFENIETLFFEVFNPRYIGKPEQVSSRKNGFAVAAEQKAYLVSRFTESLCCFHQEFRKTKKVLTLVAVKRW
jgi:hypothetical protein